MQAPPDSPEPQEIKRYAVSGPIPDYMTTEQLDQLQLGGPLQAGQQAPPGFEQKEGSFADSTTDGIPGPSDTARQGLISASPVRGARDAYQPGQILSYVLLPCV